MLFQVDTVKNTIVTFRRTERLIVVSFSLDCLFTLIQGSGHWNQTSYYLLPLLLLMLYIFYALANDHFGINEKVHFYASAFIVYAICCSISFNISSFLFLTIFAVLLSTVYIGKQAGTSYLLLSFVAILPAAYSIISNRSSGGHWVTGVYPNSYIHLAHIIFDIFLLQAAICYLISQYIEEVNHANIEVKRHSIDQLVLQEQLIKSNSMYRSLVNNTPISVIVSDMDWNILFINQMCKVQFGLAEKNTKELQFNKLFNCQSMTDEILEELKHTGESKNKKMINRLEDGQEQVILISSNYIEFESRKAIISILNDISEEHKIEMLVQQNRELTIENEKAELTELLSKKHIEELRAEKERVQLNEQRLSAILNFMPIPVAVINNEGLITYQNELFIKTLEYTWDSVPNINDWWKNAYPDQQYRDSVKQHWEQALNNAIEHETIIRPFENTITNRNGQQLEMIISGIPIFNGVLVTFTDMTELKKFEKEQLEMLKTIENSAVLYYSSNLLNNRLMYANKAMRDILNVQHQSDISSVRLDAAWNFKSDVKRFYILSVLEKEDQWSGENILIDHQGNELFVWQSIVAHKNKEGVITHTSTTAIDISRNKLDEEKLKQLNNELRELSVHLQQIREQEKREIARDIHDELGQSLTVIKFGLHDIRKDKGRSLIDKEMKIAELIREVDQTMLSFRRVTTSLHPAMLEESGLYATVEWYINNLKKSGKLQVSFLSNLEMHDKNLLSFSKSLSLYRVIQESITNIIRYANAENVLVQLKKHKDVITLTVEDDGCGFDASMVDMKEHHGLIGMRERIYSLDGHISIHSEIGKGTTITVRIPC